MTIMMTELKNNMDIESKFKEFTSNGFFKRVDDNHILDLFIGIDKYGKKFLELHHTHQTEDISSTYAIEIAQYKKDNSNILRFYLTNNDIETHFYSFCDDLIEQSRGLKSSNQGYSFLLKRFYNWKKLFKNTSSVMNEKEILGLIGELYYLKNFMFTNYSIHEAINSWTGSIKTHKDFSLKNKWIEVKTVQKNSLTVKISSIEQLDSIYKGILCVVTLEKMSEQFNGINLNSLVEDTMKEISNLEDLECFNDKLSKYGYSCNLEYDKFVYEVIECNQYLVDEHFPKLSKKLLPNSIVKASYEIALNSIVNNLIKE